MPYLKINYEATDGNSIFETIYIPSDSTGFLHRCYDLIGCDSIEVASTLISGIVMIVDEMGKCWDGWEDRINEYASFLYANPIDPIVGNVILARRVGSELYPLSDADVYHIRHALSVYFGLEVSEFV